MSRAMHPDPAVAEAVRLFNEGSFREAIDAFEVPYHEGPAELRDLHLGLVRAAACLHHLGRGALASARRLHASGCLKLAPFAPVAGGIRVDRLLLDLDRALAGLAGGEGAAGAADGWRPRIELADDGA